jgi:hypothetical protein
MINQSPIINPNEIIFGDDEFVFDIGTESDIMRLIVGDNIYIETNDDIFWYNKDLNCFKNDEGLELILSEGNKKLIEEAFNITKI